MNLARCITPRTTRGSRSAITEQSLRIRLFRVSLLDDITKQASITVDGFRAFQGSKGTAELVEEGGFGVFIVYHVALVHVAAFEFAVPVADRELCALLDAEAEESPHVDLVPTGASFARNIAPLSHRVPTPHALVLNITPFLVYGLHGFLI